MTICVDDVEKLDNIWVVHFFEQRNLSDCRAGNTFIFCFKANFFEGYNSASVGEVSGFVDNAVCACRSDMVRDIRLT